MKYAVVFDSKMGADKMLEFLQVARINAVTVEMMEDTYCNAVYATIEGMKQYLIKLHMEESERRLAKLKADYLKAYNAFQQAPTPALASVLKRMGAKIKRDSKKQKEQQ